MQLALVEPHVVDDAVPFEVCLQLFDVFGQRVVDERPAALLRRRVEVLVPVLVREFLRALADVVPVVAVLGEGDRFLAPVKLEVAGLEGEPEFFDLVAGVVDVELAGHVVARPVKRGREAVAQRAAARVAHVHGPGGVGGDELDLDLFPAPEAGAAEGIPLAQHRRDHVREPRVLEEEVDEARAGDLRPVKGAAREVEVLADRLGDLAGRAFEGRAQAIAHAADCP